MRARTAGGRCSQFGRAHVRVRAPAVTSAEPASRDFLAKTYSLAKRRMCVCVAFWMMRPMDEDVFWRGTDVCVCVCVCVRVRVPGRPWPPCVCSALPAGRQTDRSVPFIIVDDVFSEHRS